MRFKCDFDNVVATVYAAVATVYAAVSDARAAPWHKVARHSERGGAVTDRGLKDGSRGRGEK